MNKSAPQESQSVTADTICTEHMIAENDKITVESNLQLTSQVNKGVKQQQLDLPLLQISQILTQSIGPNTKLNKRNRIKVDSLVSEQ